MRNLIFIIVFFLLTGCAAEKRTYLPDLESAASAEQEHDCTSVFPRGKWQFVHSIDFTKRDGTGTTIVGITSLSTEKITSALITVEGLTLFEADFYNDNSFNVHRALPPFDRTGFAKGMMHDIRAIFQPPQSDVRQGQTRDGIATCRYTDSEGRVTDIQLNKDDCWQITSYNPSRIMVRSIKGRSCINKGFTRIPEHLELKTYGSTGYTLSMKLLRADILP